MLQRTLAARFGGMKTNPDVFFFGGCFKNSRRQKIFRAGRNNRADATVFEASGIRRSQNRFRRDQSAMTITTRIAFGISAASIALGLVLSPAAFAEDKMGKDSMMKKDTMSKDTMKKDTMSKDGMKKDDAMKKDSMKKDDMKK
jgi:pentapeptide MXKDX repeat protein